MRRVLPIVIALIVACSVNAQVQQQLLGKVVKGDDPPQVPVVNAKVVLDEAGSRSISDNEGLFHLFLPDVLRSGDEVTVTVTAPGYAVFEPAGGQLRIPSDPGRT